MNFVDKDHTWTIANESLIFDPSTDSAQMAALWMKETYMNRTWTKNTGA